MCPGPEVEFNPNEVWDFLGEHNGGDGNKEVEGSCKSLWNPSHRWEGKLGDGEGSPEKVS